MALPKFTDVVGIANDLGSDNRYRRLATVIRKACVAQSCASDLSEATTCCEALGALLVSPRKKGTLERSSTENALLMNAVMLYARATSTGSGNGERGSINISSKLTPHQRSDHASLVEVRNRALAHVHPSELVADDIWHKDKLFLVETAAGWKPASASHRFQFHRPTYDILKRQIPIARKLVIEIFHNHTNALTDLFTENPVPASLFEKNLFDPISLFGSKQAVAKALDAMPMGWAAGLTEAYTLSLRPVSPKRTS